MTQLTRRSMETNGPRTRVLLVRRPIRPVQSGDQPNSLSVRLALGVIATVGGIVLLWFLGMIGFHFGARTVFGSVPMRATLTEPLLVGVMILMESPRSIFTVALREPLWFLLGFLMIAIPGGAIAAARKPTPGGPRPHQLTIAFAYLGAIIAVLYAAAAIAWMLSPMRGAFISAMPPAGEGVQEWASRLRFVAGCDMLVLIAAVLWVVLVGRLAIPLWMRSIAVTAVLTGALLLAAAAAMTAGAVTHAHTARPVLHLQDDSATAAPGSNGDATAARPRPRALLLGHTDHHVVVLHAQPDIRPTMRLLSPSSTMRIIGESSLVEYLQPAPPAQ